MNLVHSHGHHHGHDVGERLYLHRHSVTHSLPAHVKIMTVLAFISVSVSTPITRWPAFVAFFLLLVAAALASKIPLLLLFKRALIEIPFIFFAILMPFFGTGEKFEIAGIELYREGLLAGTSIVVKGTLGVLAAVILSTTTTAREILRGLERLKLPAVMVQIASFMLRYVNVISDEMERMKVARESRGFVATGIKHWKVLATSAAALFIRSYERGERVHLAMLSRGFDGNLPSLDNNKATQRQWATALSLPGLALSLSLFFFVIGW
uniref:cobalt ECF transporter T component CbiQ n=1 Tax=Candidatus Planktophila sp. TaxID=2175601 RepID=UPI00404ABFC9